MKNFYFILLWLLVVIQSCIPTKDFTYLQKSSKTKINSEGIIETVDSEYRFKVADIISLNIISRDPEISLLFGSQVNNQVANEPYFYLSGLTINNLGEVEVPTIGRLNVLNKTINEVKELIEKELKKIYKDSTFTVRIQYSGIYYTIMGEVNGPGTRVLYRNKVNILEAISSAGDIPLTGKLKKVKLYRDYPSGKKLYTLDLTKEEIINSEQFYIKPNDLIVVEPKWQKSWGIGINTIGTLGTVFSIVTGFIATYFTIQAIK
ncbi:MAG: polysaccharide biosynthesis/export family protein [Solirubrobacteraceae bacterium]